MRVMEISTLITLLTIFATLANAISRGDIIFQHSFDGSAEQAIWYPFLGPLVQLVNTDRGSQALRIERNRANSSSTWIFRELQFQTLLGCKIRIQAVVKAENVSQAPKPWNGIKIMLHTQAMSGDNYPQQNLPQGSFDWRSVDYVASIPFDTQRAVLGLGLEEVTGMIWFDDLKVTVYNNPRPRPPPPPTGLPFKGHNLTRLRGAMIGMNLKEQVFRDFRRWNANHVRWQLLWNGFPHSPADDGNIPAYQILIR